MAKITLITVCRNGAQVLRTALDSVLAQQDADVEYLVVDGASSDGTVGLLREYEPRFAGRLRWISEPDRGMYDALNKGLRMATGEIVGILNADDVLADDRVLARVASALTPDLDGTYADVRFVRSEPGLSLGELRTASVSRYCSGRNFRPWMFRFGVQTAHPSTFFRRSCFDRWGEYSLDYGMFGDFELLLRFIWKNRARMRYLPFCTTVMRLDGASTSGLKSTFKINRADRRALRDNGCFTSYLLLYARYPFKVWGFLRRR